MKTVKCVLALTATLLAGSLLASAADAKPDPKAKPYPLKTCVVSGEKLGEMGDPYVFTRDGQEVKLCCKSCLKDFNKNPSKYMKKIAEGGSKSKKGA